MSNHIKKRSGTKKPNGYWRIKENCIAEAKKYNTPREWQLGSPGSMVSSYKLGWFHECCGHMNTKKKKKELLLHLHQKKKIKKVELSISERIKREEKIMSFLGFNCKLYC